MKSPILKGFTLIEMLVVVLLIGILSAFAVPMYIKSVENSKADDAASTVQMIATTHRMYWLDRTASVPGQFPGGVCACPAAGVACDQGVANPCQLVCCGYLGNQDWSQKAYDFFACDRNSGAGGTCCTQGVNTIACTVRKTSGNQGTSRAPYCDWEYIVDQNGVITPQGTTPPPPS